MRRFTNYKISDMPIDLARIELKQRQNSFNLPSGFNSEEFRILANGFFQSEGHISCRIKGKYFIPIFVINQNLYEKSSEFFLTLWHELGRTGSLTLTKNEQGKLIIRLSSENWDIILNKYANYFNLIYGEKYISFQKLSRIRLLTNKKVPSTCSLYLAVTLVYSLSSHGKDRKISIKEQLNIFNLDERNKPTVDIFNYKDNSNTNLSIIFIIGLILGDGTLYLRLRKSNNNSIWLIPILLIPQIKDKYNDQFLSLIKSYFHSSLNINSHIKTHKTKEFDIRRNIGEKHFLETLNINDSSNKSLVDGINQNTRSEMTVLTVEGQKFIFENLLLEMKSFSHYFYWKIDQYELLSRVATIVNVKGHLTLYGFKSIPLLKLFIVILMRENKQKIIGTKVLSLFSITRQNLPYQVKIIFNLFPDLLKLMKKQRLGNVYFLIYLK